MKVLISTVALMVAGQALAEPNVAQVAAQHVFDARGALNGCMHDQVLRLGRGNQESADTLLRAGRSLCAPQDADLVIAYEGIYAPRPERNPELRKDRAAAEDAAVAALLEARAR